QLLSLSLLALAGMAADSTATIESTANPVPHKPSDSLCRLKAPSISFSCLFRARIGRPTVSNISPCLRVCVLAPDQTRKAGEGSYWTPSGRSPDRPAAATLPAVRTNARIGCLHRSRRRTIVLLLRVQADVGGATQGGDAR